MMEEMLIALITDKDKPISEHKKIADILEITEEEVDEMLSDLYLDSRITSHRKMSDIATTGATRPKVLLGMFHS